MLKQIKEKISLAALIAPVYAADVIQQVSTDKLGQYSGVTNITVASAVGWLIGLVFIISTLIFFFILVFGGVKWITSGGDEKKVAAARASITSALVGLAIVFSAWAITKLLGTLLGVDLFKLEFKSLV